MEPTTRSRGDIGRRRRRGLLTAAAFATVSPASVSNHVVQAFTSSSINRAHVPRQSSSAYACPTFTSSHSRCTSFTRERNAFVDLAAASRAYSHRWSSCWSRPTALNTRRTHPWTHGCTVLQMSSTNSNDANDQQQQQQQQQQQHGEASNVSDGSADHDTKAGRSSNTSTKTTSTSKSTSTTTNNKRTRRATTTSTTSKSSPTYITPELISELKSTIPLTALIESYNLPQFRRTSPTRAVTLCPFHDDTHPSMHIDDQRGLYKCFSCGAGGDLFNFVREYANVVEGSGEKGEMGFREAVKFVANEFGSGVDGMSAGGVGSAKGIGTGNNDASEYASGEITEERRKQLQASQAKRDRLALANAAAADYYGKCLVSHPEAGAARAHLRSRGVKPETVRRYALGYAPDAYFGPSVMPPSGRSSMKNNKSMKQRKQRGEDSLVEKLRELGFTAKEMVEAGLAIRTDKGRRRRVRTRRSTQGDNIGATRTPADAGEGGKSANSTTPVSKDGDSVQDYSDLMDRFRGRLVVPIFDAGGRNVIGFGGRHIETPSELGGGRGNKSKYTPAKYLNSPESPIFSKKTLLFGAHAAKKAIAAKRAEVAKLTLGSAPLAENQSRSSDTNIAIVIVEGYFDAIALASAGIGEVVASMGTALTHEQLEVAADAAGSHGSRIVLCFDADEAGQAAMERLCDVKMLSKISEEHSVDVHIARLPVPGEFKDPADFVQARGGEAFRAEVLGATVPWSDWYIDRLASTYQRGNSTNVESDKSFVEVCDKISTFLATFSDQKDRTRRAYAAAATLSHALASQDSVPGDDTNDAKISQSSIQLRLESDLLDMASRKAGARDAITERIERIESADGSSSPSFIKPGALVAKMSSGDGLTSLVEDIDSLSFSEGNRYGGAVPTAPEDSQNKAPQQSRSSYEYEDDKSRYSNRRSSWGNKQRVQRAIPPLIPHFAGFEFVNPTDAAWLGYHNDRSRYRKKDPPLVAGGGRTAEQREMREAIEAGEAYVSIGNENQLVYFNSNTFHGNKFLTREARNAGYGEDGVLYDGSQIGLGVPALVEQDADKLLLVAEDRLLSTLVHFTSARVAVKGAVLASLQTGMGAGPALLEWSDPDRQWLFECLTDSAGRVPLPIELQEGGTVRQLRDHLANLPDVPSGAFDMEYSSRVQVDDPHADGTTIDNAQELVDEEGNMLDAALFEDIRMPIGNQHGAVFLSGTLDAYFNVDDEKAILQTSPHSEISQETRAELTVQETLAVILRATALKRMSLIKKRWADAASALEVRAAIQNATGTSNNTSSSFADQDHAMSSQYESMEVDELRSLCTSLGERFSEALQTVQELDESAKRIGARLMDYCSTDGVEYRISTAKQEKLAKMMDEHLASLPEDPRPESPGYDGQYVFGLDEFDDSIDPHFGGGLPVD